MQKPLPAATSLRYFWIFLALLLQAVVVLALFPATRSFAWLLGGTLINVAIGLTLFGLLYKRFRGVQLILIHYLCLVPIAFVEFLIFSLFSLSNDNSRVFMGLFYPAAFPLINWLAEREINQKKDQKEAPEKERLTQRNGF